MVPAIILKGGDADAIIAQVNINQIRERLSVLAEAEALKQLVNDQKLTQTEAAKKLLKPRSWAHDVMKVWKLPGPILTDLRNRSIAFSHAKVLSRYLDKPEIMQFLLEKAKTGDVAHDRLATLGVIAEKEGITNADKFRPQKISITKQSWLRVEPIREGVRVELHLHKQDSSTEALKKIREYLKKVG